MIVSQRLVASGADIDGLVPLLDAAYRALSCKPVEVSADTGFVGEANLEAMALRRIRAYVPPGVAAMTLSSRIPRPGAWTASPGRSSWPRCSGGQASQPLPVARAK